MKNHYADRILKKLEAEAVLLGEEASQFTESKYIGLDPDGKPVERPRWRIDAKVIEFECGCRGERVTKVYGARSYDPIIFDGLPEMSVYDFVCYKHEPHMNKRVRLGGFADFQSWHSKRRPKLIGK
jgi:hypothetical protein